MRAYFFIKLGEDVVQFEISKLFEDFIFALDLRHESIQIGMGQFGQVGKLSTMIEWLNCSRLDTLSSGLVQIEK